MRWQRRGGLVAVFFLLFFGGWWRWGLPRAEEWLRARIVQAVAQATGQSVVLSSVDLHPLLLSLRLNNMRVGDPSSPLFSFHRWVFYSAFLKPAPLSWGPFSLGHSEVEAPVIRLVSGGKGWHWPSEGWRSLPFSSLQWSNAECFYSQSKDAAPLHITGTEGALDVFRGRLSLRARGGGDVGPWRVDFSATEEKSGRLSGESHFKFDGLDLKMLSPRLPREMGHLTGQGRLEGTVRLWDVSALGTGDVSKVLGPQPFWSLRGQWVGAHWTLPARAGGATPASIPLEGTWEITPDQFILRSLKLWNSLEISGQGAWPGRAGALGQFRWEGKKIPLGDVRRSGLLPLAHVPLEGWLDSSGEWAGSLSRSEGKIDVRVSEGKLFGVSLPLLTGGGEWGPKGLSLGLISLGGVISVTGDGSPAASGKGVQWAVQAKELDLSEVARLNGWPDIQGRVSGDFSLGGTPDRPVEGFTALGPTRAEGAWSIQNFRWGGHRREGAVAGHLLWNDAGLRVVGDEENFILQATVTSSGWTIHRLAYQEPDGVSLTAQGRLGTESGGLQLRARLARFPLRDIPPVTKYFPQVEGALTADGEVTGSLADPHFSGAVQWDSVRWFPGGHPHHGDMEFHGSQGHVRLPRLNWDNTVSADGAWFPGRGWQLSTTFTRADVSSVFDFRAGPSVPTGLLDGQLSLATRGEISLTALEGWGSLRWTQGRWGTFTSQRASLVFFLGKGELTLRELNVEQSSGSFQSNAQGTLQSNGEWRWKGAGQLDSFQAAGRWTGSFTTQGTTRGDRVEGVLQSPDLMWQNVPLGKTQAHLFFHTDEWGADDVSAEAGLRGRWRVRRSDGKLSGDAQFKPGDWRPFFQQGKGKNGGWASLTPGEGEARADLSGFWNQPRVDFSANITNARWREFPFQVGLSGHWEDHRLEVTTGRLGSSLGGAATFGGGISFEAVSSTASPRIDFFLDLEEGPVGPFLRALEPASRWEGTLQGRVEGTGSLAAPQAMVSASGDLKNGETLLWTARARYADQQLILDEMAFTGPEGSLKIRPGSRWSGLLQGQGDFLLSADARNVHLGPLTFFGGASFEGRWGRAEGLSGRLKGQSLWVNQQYFDRDLAQLHWSPGVVEFQPLSGGAPYVTGALRLSRWPQVDLDNLSLWDGPLRKLLFTGEVGPRRWAFDLKAEGMEADTLVALTNLDWPVTGAWDAQVHGEGSPATPDVHATIRGKTGKIGAVPYDRLEADVRWSGSTVTLRDVKVLRNEGYVLSGEARFPVTSDDHVWNGVSAHLVLTDGKLRLLEDLWPVCRKAHGSFSGELNIDPGPDGPRSAGYLSVLNGTLSNRTYARRVSNLRLHLVLVDDLLKVQAGEARVGNGTLALSGTVALNRLIPADYALRLLTREGPGVEIEIPQLAVPPGPLLSRFALFQESLKGSSRGAIRFSLDLTGPPGEHRVTGRVILDDTQFTYPPIPGALEHMRGPRVWREFWREATWDVFLKTGKGTWYRNEYVNVEINGGLHLVGRPGAWSANGKIDATQGVINYLGQNFSVTRGTFEVATDTRPGVGAGVLPYLSGEAEKVVAGVDSRGFANDDVVTMVIDRARMGEIQPRFMSHNNPSLSTDRVAIRALGLSSENQLTQEERDQLFRAGLVQLVGTSAAPFATRLAQNFGIYMITTIYEPPETPESTPSSSPSPSPTPASTRDVASYLRGAGASARIRLSDRLFGVYKVTLDEAQSQVYFHDEVELVYRVAKSLHLRASTELDSEKLLGQPPNRRISLENQWRFGLPQRKKSVPKP